MKKFLQLALVGIISLVLVVPAAYAADGGLSPDTDPAAVSKDDVTQVILNIINWLLGFAALAATAFLILGGYKWMSSGGSAQGVEEGKQIVIGAIIGLLMIILAAVLVNTIIGLFGK